MLWLILSLTSALFWSFYHLSSRHVLKQTDPKYLTYGIHLVMCMVFLPFVVMFRKMFVIDLKVLLLLCFLGLELALAELFYMNALKHGNVGRTVPLLSITPIFTLLIGFLILSELPTSAGILGILLIVAGVYVLNMERIDENILEPFKAVIKQKGPRYMLFVAVIFGLGSVVDKYTIISSNVATRLILYPYFVLLFQTAILMAIDRKAFINKSKSLVTKKAAWVFALVFFSFALQLAQFLALHYTYVAYVISVKRSAALFSVILAYFIFKEKKHFLNSLAGTLLMLAGGLLLAL